MIEAYYQNGTKVYDESFMWNSPFDKRIPFDKFPPATLSQRKGKSEEELKPILDIDEIYIDTKIVISSIMFCIGCRAAGLVPSP